MSAGQVDWTGLEGRVKAGARVRDRVVLLKVEDKGRGRPLVTTRHTIEIEGEEKPAMVAESLVMLVRRA